MEYYNYSPVPGRESYQQFYKNGEGTGSPHGQGRQKRSVAKDLQGDFIFQYFIFQN